jgi:hypothetical protein
MKRRFLIMLCSALCTLLQAQPAPADPGISQKVWIPKGAKVQFRLMQGLNTATNHKGDIVRLELASDVVVGGTVVLPAGTQTTAKITCSRPGRGKESARIDFSDPELSSAAGEKIRLLPYNPSEVWEDGPGIVLGLAIATPVIVAVGVAALPAAAVVHLVRRHHKKPPEHHIAVDPGMTFTYYTREKTPVNIDLPAGATP